MKTTNYLFQKLTELFRYKTLNTALLDANFDPKKPYRFYGTLGRAQYETFTESFITMAKKKGKFRAIHLNAARKLLGNSDLENMTEEGYLCKETRWGVPVVSPTYKALKSMFGTDINHEAISTPFGYVEGKPSAPA
jgi:hypothetical protein